LLHRHCDADDAVGYQIAGQLGTGAARGLPHHQPRSIIFRARDKRPSSSPGRTTTTTKKKKKKKKKGQPR
jgi:hypothetical protein